MARNSRWDNQARFDPDNQDIKYGRYENDSDHHHEPSPRKIYYNQQDSHPAREQEMPPQMRYNRFNQELPPRSLQDYPLPLTLPVPIAVPPSLEYEPM